MRKIVVFFLTFFLLLISVPSTYMISQSQNIQIEPKTVVYNLPYPGILPDHPLYFLKSIRDDLLLVTTRDPNKKAQLLLHLSDKQIATSKALLEKGKEEKALGSLDKSQDLFKDIFSIIKTAKAQGQDVPSEFKETLLQSNTKHKEVVSEILEEVSEANIPTIQRILETNQTILNEIEKT
ncbi:hypothetical protein KC726_03040 [Candidatus Woesebacteria bacterium]|nr:hypothetical protein [Candidatus Woesebacteria bacterium]